MNTDFIERLQKLIDDNAAGKPALFATKAGIAPGTFHAYTKGRLPQGEQLIRIHKTYRVNIDWLLTGKGEPYLRDVPAQEPGREENNRAGEPVTQQPDFRISDALTMTAEVLESGTSYATALYLNIQHFHRAISAEKRIEQLELEVSSLRERMIQLEKHFTAQTLESNVNTKQIPENGPLHQKTA